MDTVGIVAIIAGVGALLTAIYTHIKHSQCFGVVIDTYNPSEIPNITITPHNTPQLQHISLETKV